MVRFLIILLASILLITVLRAIIGIIMRGFTDMIKGEPETAATGPQRPDVPIGGELKKDPVCGTFVSTSTAMKKVASGETVYFCSTECRDKFRG